MRDRPGRLLDHVSLGLPLLAILGSCTGVIDDAPAGPDMSSSSTDPTVSIAAAAGCPAMPAIEHAVIRRLGRTEYNNTIRDLVGMDVRPADDFAPDPFSKGFDNIAAAMSFDVNLLGQMDGAAERLSRFIVQAGIIKCNPANAGKLPCARQVLAPFMRRAWRRPVTPAEVDQYASLVTLVEMQNDAFERGIELAIQAVVLSPDFIYLVEAQPASGADKPWALDGFALASRLSYFLWKSMPDESLLQAAESGRLADPNELATQVQRMLADPKASVLGEELSRQWLMGRRTAIAPLDPRYKLDTDLRAGLLEESARFLGAFFRENLPLLDVLDADFTFLNERVAKHYRIPGVTGAAFRKVSLAGSNQRGGLLTLGSLMVGITVEPAESEVHRGLWALRNLECMDVGPPPPDAGTQQSMIAKALGPNATRRQVVEARDATFCGNCHRQFDPLGLALENYDLAGAWRTRDGTAAIDARGETPELGSFSGPRELSAALKKSAAMPGCLATTLFRLGLGRIETRDESCVLRALATDLASRGQLRPQDLFAALVQSPLFRRQGPDKVVP